MPKCQVLQDRQQKKDTLNPQLIREVQKYTHMLEHLGLLNQIRMNNHLEHQDQFLPTHSPNLLEPQGQAPWSIPQIRLAILLKTGWQIRLLIQLAQVLKPLSILAFQRKTFCHRLMLIKPLYMTPLSKYL